MAIRTIKGYLTTTNAGTVLTKGQSLTAAITSYDASVSGTITAVSVSFSRNIVLYSTSSLKLYLNGSDHGTTATYSDNTALFDFVECPEKLLSTEPTSVYFTVNSGAVYYSSSQPTFTITITYEETTATVQPPRDLSISIEPGTLNYTLTWSPATGGVGTLHYVVSCNGIYLSGSLTTECRYEGTVDDYGEYTFTIVVSDLPDNWYIAESEGVTASFENTPVVSNPTITFVPNFKYSASSGTTLELSWDNFTIQNSGYSGFYYVISYRKITNGVPGTRVQYATSATNKYNFTQTAFLSELGASEGQQYNFGVHVFAYGLTNTVNGSTLTSEIIWSSNIFTYKTGSTVSDPKNVEIKQELNGTYTMSWDASIGTNGSGSVTYTIKNGEGDIIRQNFSGTSFTEAFNSYNYLYTWFITAQYSGATSNTIRINKSFEPPTIEKPDSIAISPSSGSSVEINWDAAELKNTTGNIEYTLYYKLNNGSYTVIKSLTNTSIVLNESDLSEWGQSGDTFIFQVKAYASNLSSNVDGNYNLLGPATSPDSSQFTFITGNVVGYYINGAWQECTVYYYDGSEWVECIPYYYDNGWQEINTKIE